MNMLQNEKPAGIPDGVSKNPCRASTDIEDINKSHCLKSQDISATNNAQNRRADKYGPIPHELKERHQWVAYKIVPSLDPDKKDQKIPIDVKTGKGASSTNPKTWTSFDEVLDFLDEWERYEHSHFDKKQGELVGVVMGPGYVFSKDDPYTGIDLDDCINHEGSVEPWADKIVSNLNSWTEVSQSGKGLHTFVRGKKPGKKCRKEKIECYDQSRFFAMTGNSIGPTEIADRQLELNNFYYKYLEGKGRQDSVKKADQDKVHYVLDSFAKPDPANFENLCAAEPRFVKVFKHDNRLNLADKSLSTYDASLATYAAKYGWTDQEIANLIIAFRHKHGDANDQKKALRVDYIERTIAGARKHLKNSARETFENIDPDQLIEEMNQRHAIIVGEGKVIFINEEKNPYTKQVEVTFSQPKDLRERYANQMIPNPSPGRGKPKLINPFDYWLSHFNRREYQRIIFAPNEEIAGCFNLYKGFAIKPSEKGSCERYKEHLFSNVCNKNEQHYNYLFSMLADSVQNPGGPRPGTAVVQRGKKGCGKGIAVREFGKIFGKHFLHLTNISQITGRFNTHLRESIIVFGDEIRWNKRNESGVLKGLITEPEIQIEAKFHDMITVKNNVRMFLATDGNWAVPADLDERRFFCLDVNGQKANDHAYFKKIIDEMNSGGRERLLYELLNHKIEINLRQPPKTQSLLDQVNYAMPPEVSWWFELLYDGCIAQVELIDELSLEGIEKYWPEKISKNNLFSIYLNYMNFMKYGSRMSKSQLFRDVIYKYCPEILEKRTCRKDGNGKELRSRMIILPSLRRCRELFSQQSNVPIDWPDDEFEKEE